MPEYHYDQEFQQDNPFQDPQLPDDEDRMYGLLCHVLALSAFMTGIGMIVGPLIAWLLLKENRPFVDACGKEAINFNITAMILSIIFVVVVFMLCFLLIGFVLIPLLIVMPVIWLALVIIATIKASQGQIYRYPFSIRFIR